MNPSEKWNDLEKYVYGEHKASCMLEAGGYACTCGKQEAAADLARITAERDELLSACLDVMVVHDLNCKTADLGKCGCWTCQKARKYRKSSRACKLPVDK